MTHSLSSASSYFSKILVAVDGSPFSEKAFDVATELVKCMKGAEVILVHVVPPSLPAEGIDSSALKTMEQEYESEGSALLTRYEARAKEKTDNGKLPSIVLATGSEGKTILRIADENKVDLIVVGHRGMGKLRELVMGSVAHYVSNNSKVSVMIIQ